jgi:hypothetical protein
MWYVCRWAAAQQWGGLFFGVCSEDPFPREYLSVNNNHTPPVAGQRWCFLFGPFRGCYRNSLYYANRILNNYPPHGLLPWRGGRPCASSIWRRQTKEVRDKVASKGHLQNYWTEAVQETTIDDRPDLSSEGAPDIDKTVNVKQKLISGHKTQMGLETKTYWPTDRRS